MCIRLLGNLQYHVTVIHSWLVYSAMHLGRPCRVCVLGGGGGVRVCVCVCVRVYNSVEHIDNLSHGSHFAFVCTPHAYIYFTVCRTARPGSEWRLCFVNFFIYFFCISTSVSRVAFLDNKSPVR